MGFRRTRCPQCRAKLDPGQRIHPECVSAYADAQAEKAERARAKKARLDAKVERAEIRRRKEDAKTLPQLLKEAQIEFNRWIRQRDHDKPCICCGRPLGDGDVGGGFDCGHYRSVGSAPHLRFTEANAHAQRKQCNRWGAGRAVDYRIGLLARIGRVAVEALESDNAVHKWTKDEVRVIRDEYRARNRANKE